MNAITIATFDRLEDAKLLKNCLEKAGLQSVIHDESKLQRFWFMAEPVASIKVQVDSSEFESAKHLLPECDKACHALQNAVLCPQCGSSRIEYPQYTRKFITPILVEFFISLGLFPKEYYCQDCQYTWPRKVEAEPATDLLGWPVSGPGATSIPAAASSRRTETKTNVPEAER